MQIVAVAWLVSLVVDAAQGRVSWLAVFFAGLLTTAWLRWSMRPFMAVASACDAGSGLSCLYWRTPADDLGFNTNHAGGNVRGWTDSQGQPVSLNMVFDLGPLCLICLRHSARPGEAFFHWIDAASLNGPWRWRLMMASSALLPPEITPLSNSSHRSARRLA